MNVWADAGEAATANMASRRPTTAKSEPIARRRPVVFESVAFKRDVLLCLALQRNAGPGNPTTPLGVRLRMTTTRILTLLLYDISFSTNVI